MEYRKEDLEKYLFLNKLNYREIGNIYGVSGVWIRKKCLQMGIEISDKKRPIFNCLNCKKEIHRMAGIPKYCNNKCQNEYQRNLKTKYWLENQHEFSNVLISKPDTFIKPYLYSKQDFKCKICGVKNEWNGKPMIFILDHIDGNASDNREENLRLICHNCDSQLITYKSKNKKSARVNRYK